MLFFIWLISTVENYISSFEYKRKKIMMKNHIFRVEKLLCTFDD